MKKIMLPVLVLLPAVAGLASCGPSGPKRDNTKTQIDIDSYTGGVGSKWLQDAIDGFTKLTAEKSYENGRVGVEIHPNYTKSIDTSSIRTNPKIFFTEDFGFPHDLAGQKALLDITDVVTGKAVDEKGEEAATIESKIDADYSKLLQYNGKYYGLPHYEWYPGLTYNKDLFDGVTAAARCFYLSANETSYSVTLGSKTYYFVDKDDLAEGKAKKTCGNDGEYDTADDGLPSCLPEFIALCKYMDESGVKALICPGNHTDYTGHLLNGLVASLSTPEALRAYQSFEGKINHITSIGNDGDYLFEGSGLGTPKWEEVKLNDNLGVDRQDGYKTRGMLERYAATALLKYLVANKENYFFPTSYDGSTINRAAQQFFIENGFPGSTGSGERRYEIGMMCEGNYWVNEARDDGGLFEVFESKNPGVKRHLGWMPLPVNILDPVEPLKDGETAKKPELLDTGNSYCMVSQAVQTNKGSTAAIKDFLRYLYSDSRLQAFTKTTGICKAAMKYDIASIQTDMEFQRDVLNIKDKNGVRNPGHDNAVFYKNRNDFSFSINYPIFRDKDNLCFFDAFSKKNKSAQDCFNETTITEKDWNDKYLPK